MPLKQSKKRRGVDGEAAKERRISLKKEELGREINYGILNTERNIRSSEEMMTKVKMPIFREEVEVAWRTFDRSFDAKDHESRMIVDAVEIARDGYEQNFASHAGAIDHFVNIYRTRLDDHEKRYRENLEELVMIFMKDHKGIEERDEDDELSIGTIIFSTKQYFEESSNDARGIAIAKVDVLKESNENSRRLLATILESEMSDRWKELREILENYENSTKQRRQAYETIKAKDDRERNIIDRQISTTAILSETIRKLKDKIGHFGTAANERIAEITAEQKFFHDSFRMAKERFLSEERMDKARLVFLTREYKKTFDRMRELVRKAEKILLIMHECGKYETEDEKILQPTFLNDNSLDNDENEVTSSEM